MIILENTILQDMQKMINFKLSTIWTADNLKVMRGMNSECVDLIYLDPPFNSKADYAASIGNKAAGAEFKDTWTLKDVDMEWINLLSEKHKNLHRIIQSSLSNSNKSYLAYMAVRVLEMHRILKSTGSMFLHCDPTMSHWLKIVLDCVFGVPSFRNEIVWGYTGPGSPKMRQFNRKHDIIFWYSKGKTWTFNADDVRVFHKDGGPHIGGFTSETDVGLNLEKVNLYAEKGKIPETWWIQEKGNGLAIASRQKKQYTGYPTQKPLALLERIIKASSNEGEIIFDPFCGCATALVAADRLNRNWVGIDVSPKAVELVNKRIKQDREDEGSLWRGMKEKWTGATERTDLPQRTDLGNLPHYKQHHDTLYGEQKGFCAGCGEFFQSKVLVVDHIVAISNGGTDHKDNLQLLCGHCNSVKGNRNMEYLKAKLEIA